jgi:hypothetical protein
VNLIWLWLSAATMTLTALTHSLLGEKLLIGPVLALKTGVTAHPLARQVLRFAWHLTSALMLLTALTVLWPTSPTTLVVVIGATWLTVGLFDAVVTRGKHVGWPLLASAGLFAVLGAAS